MEDLLRKKSSTCFLKPFTANPVFLYLSFFICLIVKCTLISIYAFIEFNVQEMSHNINNSLRISVYTNIETYHNLTLL